MRCRRWVVVGLGLFVLGSGDATPARASSLLTYVFQGTLTSIGDQTHEFGTGTQVGTPFTLQFSVATDAPNMNGEGAPYGGLYKIAPQDLSLTLNGQPFAPASLQPSASGGSVYVVRGTGSFGGTESFEGPGPGLSWLGVNFYLRANSGTFPSDALPTSLNLSDYTNTLHPYVFTGTSQPYLYLSGYSAATKSYSDTVGIITSATVSVQPVPEPGTFLVVALGAVGFLGRCRLRRMHDRQG